VIAHLGDEIGLRHTLDTGSGGGKSVKSTVGGIDPGVFLLMTFLVTLHPCPVKACGNIVLHLACPDTGSAPDTFVEIDDVGIKMVIGIVPGPDRFRLNLRRRPGDL
jgi:hypothetical protein